MSPYPAARYCLVCTCMLSDIFCRVPGIHSSTTHLDARPLQEKEQTSNESEGPPVKNFLLRQVRTSRGLNIQPSELCRGLGILYRVYNDIYNTIYNTTI